MDFDFVVIMLHVLLSSEVLSRNHVFCQLIDQFLRSALHLTSHQEGGSPCEWPALSSFMQTMMFQFGQSCINLLTGLGYTDCGRHSFLTAREFMSRHNITHFSVQSLQSMSPAARFNVEISTIPFRAIRMLICHRSVVTAFAWSLGVFFVYICASTSSIY